jgi:hypothetical protein
VKSAKQLDFERWAAELDYRSEHQPRLFAFHCDYENGKVLTMEESETVQNNLASYEKQFKGLKPCKGCGYPLEEETGFYVADVGLCCWMCHDMDSALRQTRQQGTVYGTIFEWFDAAHKGWVSDGQPKSTDEGDLV